MTFIVRSPDAPDGKGIECPTREFAEIHCRDMNEALRSWPRGWNTQYWVTKPRPWIIEESPVFGMDPILVGSDFALRVLDAVLRAQLMFPKKVVRHNQVNYQRVHVVASAIKAPRLAHSTLETRNKAVGSALLRLNRLGLVQSFSRDVSIQGKGGSHIARYYAVSEYGLHFLMTYFPAVIPESATSKFNVL